MPDIENKEYAGANALAQFKKNLIRVECIANNPDLIGETITATLGVIEVTGTIGDDQHCTLKLPRPGVWTLVESLYSTEKELEVNYYGNYEIEIGGDVFITVNYTEDFYYENITLTDAELEHSYTKRATTSGSMIFGVAQYTTWTASSTIGGKTYSASVNCPEPGNYEIDLVSSYFDLQEWLDAGGVVGTYADLDAVFADEKAVRKLMTVHASVDYLVSACEVALDENVQTIINDNYCAKWINLRDYALDTLYANEYITDAMDTADKYFYGEWGIIDGSTVPQTWGPLGNVPIMTSNTAPYGEVIYSSGNPENTMYKVFTENGEDVTTVSGSGSNGWIGFHFVNPINVKKVFFRDASAGGYRIKSFKIQGSDDNSIWNDIDEVITMPYTHYYDGNIDNDEYYLYYRVYVVETTSNLNPLFNKLQFYGREQTNDTSEREFESGSYMKYIFDHGVELEPISFTGNGTEGINTGNTIKLSKATNGTMKSAISSSKIDITNFNMFIAKVKELITSGGNPSIGIDDVNDIASPLASSLLTPIDTYLDISSINGEQYPFISTLGGGTNTSLETTELILDKYETQTSSSNPYTCPGDGIAVISMMATIERKSTANYKHVRTKINGVPVNTQTVYAASGSGTIAWGPVTFVAKVKSGDVIQTEHLQYNTYPITGSVSQSIKLFYK